MVQVLCQHNAPLQVKTVCMPPVYCRQVRRSYSRVVRFNGTLVLQFLKGISNKSHICNFLCSAQFAPIIAMLLVLCWQCNVIVDISPLGCLQWQHAAFGNCTSLTLLTTTHCHEQVEDVAPSPTPTYTPCIDITYRKLPFVGGVWGVDEWRCTNVPSSI